MSRKYFYAHEYGCGYFESIVEIFHLASIVYINYGTHWERWPAPIYEPFVIHYDNLPEKVKVLALLHGVS